MLSETQKAQYARDGYLVLDGFKPIEEIRAVRARAEAIVEAFDPGESVSIFTTREQERKSDEYFLTLGIDMIPLFRQVSVSAEAWAQCDAECGD